MQANTIQKLLDQSYRRAKARTLNVGAASSCDSTLRLNGWPVGRGQIWSLRAFALILAVAANTGQIACGQTRGGNGGGGDIILFDIVGIHSAVSDINGGSTSASRPAGGNGGGGDIIVFDIVGIHSAVSDINGGSTAASRPAGGNGGGGDIIVFDIVGVVAGSPTAFWCLVVTKDEILIGILELDEQVDCSKPGETTVVGGLLWLEGSEPVPLLVRLQFRL